ncbi:MAG: hypothetical protein V1844_09905 [Pseudomonadota bacterium]
MPSAKNAKLSYEAGQALVAMVALTDSGDHLKFNSADSLWSDKSGYDSDVKPNGILTGLVGTPAAAGTNDLVDVSGGTLNLNGVVTTVAAGADKTCLRGATTDICRTNSITINAVGAITVVSGTAAPTVSETRGAAGGPPFIPVDSVELFQVRFTSTTAAAVLASEIKAIPNTHREQATFPTYDPRFIRVTNGVLGVAGIDFTSAPMLSHTGSLAKKVYAQYYTPAFAEIPKASDYKRSAESQSVSSTPYYGGASAAVSVSLGQGGFKALLNDGITDAILAEEGNKIWFKFQPDRLKTPHILDQGYLGLKEQFPPGGDIMADFTIGAGSAGSRVSA